MFIVVKKVHSRRILAVAALAAVTVALTGAGLELSGGSVPQIQSAGAMQAEDRGVRSNEDRVAFLTRLGWEVKPEPASIEDVLIPETFDESYADYLSLQREQGFDLAPYGGRTVKRYTYQVTNFPGLQENIWAVLLVFHRTVIGGEVYCSSGDGFTRGLDFPGREQGTAG